jgi:uncharacterized protein YceK
MSESRLILVMIVLVSQGGCGTLLNLAGDSYAGMQDLEQIPARSCFGGVRTDVTSGIGYAKESLKPQRPVNDRLVNVALATSILAVDLPLSLIADVVFLPGLLWETAPHDEAEAAHESNTAWHEFAAQFGYSGAASPQRSREIRKR